MKKERLRGLTVKELIYLAMKLGRKPEDVMDVFMGGGTRYRELVRAILDLYGVELPDTVKLTEADAAKILRATADREWGSQLKPASVLKS